jgi:hypothetical protein
MRWSSGAVSWNVRPAGCLSFEDFRLCVQRWELLADVDGAHRDAESAVERRTATVVEFDGVLHIDARGGAVHAASMVEMFQRFCDAEFATDTAWLRDHFGEHAPHDLMPRSDAQRRFDALLAIFEAAAVAPVDGQAPEPVDKHRRRPGDLRDPHGPPPPDPDAQGPARHQHLRSTL